MDDSEIIAAVRARDSDVVAPPVERHEGRRAEVERGDVRSAVRQQPTQQAFVFATPDAETIVVGATFQVPIIDHRHTHVVVVTEGQMLVKHRLDGAEIAVCVGSHVFMGPKGKLTAHLNAAKRGYP